MSTGWILVSWLSLTVLVDVLSTRRERKTWERCLDEPDTAERLRLGLYLRSTVGVSLWTVATLVVVQLAFGDVAVSLGLRLPEFDSLRRSTGGAYHVVLALGAVLVTAAMAWALHASWKATPPIRDRSDRRAELELVSLPTTQGGRVAYRIFVLVSVVFGELHYRALALVVMHVSVPGGRMYLFYGLAILLSGITQGAGRASQGIVSGLIAIPLAVLYASTGSVFPGIALFVLLGWTILNRYSGPSRAEEPAPTVR